MAGRLKVSNRIVVIPVSLEIFEDYYNPPTTVWIFGSSRRCFRARGMAASVFLVLQKTCSSRAAYPLLQFADCEWRYGRAFAEAAVLDCREGGEVNA